MSDEHSRVTNDQEGFTPRTDAVAALWGGGDASAREHIRRLVLHAQQLETELTTSLSYNNRVAGASSSTAQPSDEALRAIAHQHARQAYNPVGSGQSSVCNAEMKAQGVIFCALKEAAGLFSARAQGEHGGSCNTPVPDRIVPTGDEKPGRGRP